jgi:DNA-binding GntR family transcriptional regulator
MQNNEKFIFPKKSEFKKIEISEITSELPDLKNQNEGKGVVIGKWLAAWIKQSYDEGKICANYILPSKSELAYLLGVSIGTVQFAIRYVEDLGFVESKQCIGTFVKNYHNKNATVRKLTSKRDLAIEATKRYLSTGGFSVGAKLPSTKTIATITGFSVNTVRLALEYLISQNIVSHNYTKRKESGWRLESLDFDVQGGVLPTASKTLVDMVVVDLENYITNNMKVGDKLPPHGELAKGLKASVKTVHDALNVLVSRGVLLARRGTYGTSVVRMPNDKSSLSKPETSIFAPAADAAFYHYEKTQNQIKRMMAADYQVGDKLPSILELSKRMDVSPNTIRKAFHNLAKEGFLVFSRGRYGGTFVIDIPEVDSQKFKWLAVNPAYAKEYEKSEQN